MYWGLKLQPMNRIGLGGPTQLITKPFHISYLCIVAILTSLKENFWGSRKVLALDWWENWNPESLSDTQRHQLLLARAQIWLFSLLKQCHLSPLQSKILLLWLHHTPYNCLSYTLHFKCLLSTPISFLSSNSWVSFSFLYYFFFLFDVCGLPILTHFKFQMEHKSSFYLIFCFCDVIVGIAAYHHSVLSIDKAYILHA